MREQGYLRVELWLAPSELEVVKQAARLADKPVATYCRLRSFDAAASEVIADQNQAEEVKDEQATQD